MASALVFPHNEAHETAQTRSVVYGIPTDVLPDL